MKLDNSRVNFYLFFSYLYKIYKNHAMLFIKIRKHIFASMFMDEGINNLSFRHLSFPKSDTFHQTKRKYRQRNLELIQTEILCQHNKQNSHKSRNALSHFNFQMPWQPARAPGQPPRRPPSPAGKHMMSPTKSNSGSGTEPW